MFDKDHFIQVCINAIPGKNRCALFVAEQRRECHFQVVIITPRISIPSMIRSAILFG